MPRIRRVPEPFRNGLSNLISLDADGFQELYAALQNKPPALYSSDYFDRLTPDMTSLSREQAIEVIEALYSMSMTSIANNVPISEFIEDIANASTQGVTKNVTLNPENRGQFVERLTSLLNLDVFRVGAKATNILIEHQNRLNTARIFTELRPVFGDDVSKTPIGVVLLHTLKIEYRESEQPREFYAAMDTRDIQILIDLLERAKVKAETLKSALSKTELSLIDFD